MIDSTAALVWMANLGSVELHPWTSRLPDVHLPISALIDIDPGTHTRFDRVLELARLYWTALVHPGAADAQGRRQARSPDLVAAVACSEDTLVTASATSVVHFFLFDRRVIGVAMRDAEHARQAHRVEQQRRRRRTAAGGRAASTDSWLLIQCS